MLKVLEALASSIYRYRSNELARSTALLHPLSTMAGSLVP